MISFTRLDRHRRRDLHRRRLARSSHIAIWAFACALLLKAAVPLLASASAALQGKAIAEVCDVYGVATVALEGHGPRVAPVMAMDHAMALSHAMHGDAMHGDAMQSSMVQGQDEAPHSPIAHAMPGADAPMAPSHATPTSPAQPHHHDSGPSSHSDHCALTAVVALAATAALAPSAVRVPGPAPVISRTPVVVARIDAAARWAAQREHGPPAIG